MTRTTQSPVFLTLSLLGLVLLSLISRAHANEGVVAEEITFVSHGVELSGVIFSPSDQDPIAAIVGVHGSGEARYMADVSRLLATEGFAVLYYDKRGVGESGGSYVEQDNTGRTNLYLLADDAAAALEALATRPKLEHLPVGFVGISQAGWIIPLASKRAPADFMGIWSGPVCTVSEELHFSDWAETDPNFWRKHTPQEVEEHLMSVHYRPDDVDPSVTLTSLDVPGLWLFGERDNSIPVDYSVTRLKRLILNGKRNFEYKTFSEYGHNLADSKEQESWRFMVEWIRKTAEGIHRED